MDKKRQPRWDSPRCDEPYRAERHGETARWMRAEWSQRDHCYLGCASKAGTRAPDARAALKIAQPFMAGSIVHQTKQVPPGTKENRDRVKVLSSLRDWCGLDCAPHPALKRWAIIERTNPSIKESRPAQAEEAKRIVGRRGVGEFVKAGTNRHGRAEVDPLIGWSRDIRVRDDVKRSIAHRG